MEDITIFIHTKKLTVEQFDLLCNFVYAFSTMDNGEISTIYEEEPTIISGNLFELSDIAKDCYKVLSKAQMVRNITVIKKGK